MKSRTGSQMEGHLRSLTPFLSQQISGKDYTKKPHLLHAWNPGNSSPHFVVSLGWDARQINVKMAMPLQSLTH